MCMSRLSCRHVHSIMYAPLGFFLQNPVGELLVAFTKEQDIMDENLVDTVHYLGIYGLIMLSTVITVSVSQSEQSQKTYKELFDHWAGSCAGQCTVAAVLCFSVEGKLVNSSNENHSSGGQVIESGHGAQSHRERAREN
jgi:hypothetical protein